MKLILFTKMLRGKTVQQVGEKASELGFSGLDLAIRAGQCVNPANIATALPEAMKIWKQFGLDVPFVSLEPTSTDPRADNTRVIYETCAAAGIKMIKLGYWTWLAGEDYWQKFDQIANDLAEFEKLGQRHGICSLVHTHSDICYGSNASGAMHLVRGMDPRWIGIYLDPAHLALDGEPWPMAVAIAANYLRAIGVKSSFWERSPRTVGPRYIARFGQLDEGIVEWSQVIEALGSLAHTLPFSVHAEFSNQEDFSVLEPMIRRDVAHLKSIAV